MLKQGPNFHFEISEVEITRVDCITNHLISTSIYDKQDDFDFDVVNFPFFGWRCLSCYTIWCICSQLIRFARAFSQVSDFNNRKKILTS